MFLVVRPKESRKRISSLSFQDSPTSPPFMPNATSHHQLEKYRTPVAKDVRDNLYVDNVISASDQETEIISYYQESRSIMNAANFSLGSWAPNSPLLLREKKHSKFDQTYKHCGKHSWFAMTPSPRYPLSCTKANCSHLPVNQPPNVMYFNWLQRLMIHWINISSHRESQTPHSRTVPKIEN